jgi:hypothetical protein
VAIKNILWPFGVFYCYFCLFRYIVQRKFSLHACIHTLYFQLLDFYGPINRRAIAFFLFQLRTDEERKEASEIILAAIEMKSSIEPQWIGKIFLSIL